MTDRTVKVRLEAIVGEFQRQMAAASQSVRAVSGDLSKMAKISQSQAEQFATMGRAGVVAGGAIAAGMGLAVKAALDYETAFAGVRKTTDATEAQFAEISEGIREMSRRMPASAVEIASVAEAAGQLGVQRDAILPFTETMIQLGATTNLTADQAAVAMARIANIMQIPQAEVGRLGAALVDLGNNGASTESEILDMATRIASAGRQVGLTSAEVLAFANALSSVGIESEAGGTAISRVMIEVQNAVMDGGDTLELFARTAGTSAARFAQSFRDEPAQALIDFIEGLRRAGDAGQNTNAILDELSLSDIRVANALRAAAGAGDLFRQSVELSARAFAENEALTNEYNKRLQTTGAQLEIVKNQLVDVAITFGNEMLPAIRAVADMVSFFVGGLSELTETLGPLGPILVAMVGTVTLLGGSFLLLLPRIIATQAAMATLAATAPAAAAGLRGVMIAAGGIGAVLTLAATAFALFNRDGDDAVRTANDMAAAFDALSSGGRQAAIGETLRQLQAFGDDPDNLKDWLAVLQDLGITAEAVNDILTTHQDGSAKNVAAMKEWQAALDGAVSSGKISREEADALSQAVFRLGNDLANLVGGAAEVEGAIGGVGDAGGDAATEIGTLSERLDELYAKTFDAQAAADHFTEELRGFADAVQAAQIEGDRFATSLDTTSETGLRNRETLRGLVGALFDYASSTGASATQTAAMRGQLIEVLTQLGFNRTEAEKFTSVLSNLGGMTVTPTVTLDTSSADSSISALERRLSGLSGWGGRLSSGSAWGRWPGGSSGETDPFGFPTGGSSGAPSVADILAEGPEAQAAREQQRREQEESVSRYLDSLRDAQEERRRLEEAATQFLRAVYEEQQEIEDNQYKRGVISKERYLEILEERLRGLKAFTNEWMAVITQIDELLGRTLEAELKLIETYEAGRMYERSWQELANQRAMSPAPVTNTTITTTKNWNPTFVANGATAEQALATQSQKLRDLALVLG